MSTAPSTNPSTAPAVSTVSSGVSTVSSGVSTVSSGVSTSMVLPTVNIKSLVPVELNETNYLIWKQVFLTVLRSHNMQGYVDGSSVRPSVTLVEKDQQIVNPEFDQWIQKDMIVQSWINATLSLDMLQLVVSPENTTAREIWLTLERHFLENTASRVYALKTELRALKKGSMSMGEFLQKIKGIADALKSIGEPESDRDLVLTALHGLPEQYKGFVTAIRAQRALPTFQELRPVLLQQEVDMESFGVDIHPGSGNSSVFYANRGRGGNRGNQSGGRGRGGRGRGGRNHSSSHGPVFTYRQQPHQYSPNLNTPKTLQSSYTHQNTSQKPNPNYPNQLSRFGIQCQICGKYNHSALECRQRFNHSFVPNDLPHSFAAINLNVPEEEVWYPDTGASNHMTSTSGQENEERTSSVQ